MLVSYEGCRAVLREVINKVSGLVLRRLEARFGAKNCGIGRAHAS